MLKPFAKPIYVTRPLLPDIAEVEKKLEEIWESQWLTNCGPKHRELEEALTKRLEVPYLSLFNNGTTALMIACQALRLSGEVITTPFTFAATPHVLTWNNIKPIFCDVDPKTMNIDANKIERMITPQTTAILAVHVFGTPCDVETIQKIADYYGLKVVYDAAHAFDVKINGVGIGNFGDVSAMSFHATKLYHTVEGGALMHKNPHLKQRIDFLKNFGIKNEEEVVMPGINGKLNEISSAIGLLTLKLADMERSKRQRLIEIYREELADVPGIVLPYVPPNVQMNSQYFVLRIKAQEFGLSRDEVYEKFHPYNVFTRKYFHPLCSEYTCYRQLPSATPDNLPQAVQIGQEVLSMPLYGTLEEDEVRKICAIMKRMRQ